MNKAWITGLTLAGVAGSAGAAFAGVSSDSQTTTPVEAQGLPASTTTEAAPQTATYQVGTAGTVTVTAADGVVTVDRALPGTTWTLVGYSTPGAHVEVTFSDASQDVTFIAELVSGQLAVSVTNVPAPGATATSIEVTEVTSGASVAPPQPATPAAKPIAVAVPTPSSSHTTSPSGAGVSGSHDDDDHEDDDSHEVEHENENEGDDD